MKKKLKELNAFLKDYFKTRYPAIASLLTLLSKIATTHTINQSKENNSRTALASQLPLPFLILACEFLLS